MQSVSGRSVINDDLADQVVTLAKSDSTTGRKVIIDVGRYVQ